MKRPRLSETQICRMGEADRQPAGVGSWRQWLGSGWRAKACGEHARLVAFAP